MLRTGSPYLDRFFNYKNELSIIYGKAGTGKTTLVKLAMIEQGKKGCRTIFIDTENSFSIDRFKQLAGDNYKKLLELIVVIRVKNFKQQQLVIKSLNDMVKNPNITLIAIDTINFHYRRLLKSKSDLAKAMLISQLRILNEVSKKVPVLATNQVYTDINLGTIEMVASNIVRKFSNFIIELQKNEKRKLIIKEPVKKEVCFEIMEDNIFETR